MEICPKCQSEDIRKSGIIRYRQRYKCKSCNYHFTVNQIGKPINKRRDAIVCHLLGFNYRTCGKLLGINHVTVFQWIKQLGEPIEKLKGGKGKPTKVTSKEIRKHINEFIRKNKIMLIISNIGEDDMLILFT